MPRGHVTRTAIAVFLLGVALAGCTSAPPPEQAPSERTDVSLARELLGRPTVELGEAVIGLELAVEEARFDANRGADMAAALDDVADRMDVLDAAADAAEEATADAPVAAAVDVVERAVEAGRTARDAANAELRYLRRVARIDTALLDAAAEWDRPGSQSELRTVLIVVENDVEALAPRARRLEQVPEACRIMRRNRSEWVRTVLQRTLRLAAEANSAGGATYDELRGAFRRLPLGVEPRVADRAEKPCWQERSPLPEASDELRDLVEELEAALR